MSTAILLSRAALGRSLLFSARCSQPSGTLGAYFTRNSFAQARHLSLSHLVFPTSKLSLSRGLTDAPSYIIPREKWTFSSLVQFARTRIREATHRDYRRHGGSSGGGPNGRRTLFNLPEQQLIIYCIIGINVSVFLAWQAASTAYRGGDPSLLKFMYKHYTVSYENLRSGRIWTVLTGAFSHSDTSHALMNGLSFFFIAPSVLALLSPPRFLVLYISGALGASLTSILWKRYAHIPDFPSQGASGAILASVAYLACVSPRTTFYIFFIIPCPAWALLPGMLAYDGYMAYSDARSRTDAAGHVGGMLSGIAYFASRMGRFMIR